MRKIKILFLIDNLTGGGAEKVLQTLVNNMDANTFDITVQTVNRTDHKGYLAPYIRYSAINRRGSRLFDCWLRLCAQLKWAYPLYIRDDYDIEVAYLECGPTKMLAGSTNKNALKLAWVHCDPVKKDGFRWQDYRAYDRVICVSETVRAGFGQRAVVLPNVIDEQEIVRKSRAFPGEKATFVTVGRLSYEKGCDRLVRACGMLKAEGFGFTFLIIGEGPERQNIEKLIKDHGLTDIVKLLGFQPNPYPYMAAADAVVVPSRTEGCSTVVAEALILGKPIVATPCAGMGELLGDCEYGLITEDSVEGIYQGMKNLLTNPQLREFYTFAARERGKAFSKAAALQKTETFLRAALEEKRRETWKST